MSNYLANTPVEMHAASEPLSIALRAYVTGAAQSAKKWKRRGLKEPSPWVLIFDMETLTDPSQHRRFGFYQLRKRGELFEAGVFFDPMVLSEKEQTITRAYARLRGLKCRTIAEFVDEVFFGMAYELRANIVGFNLPFDLSRLAIRHGSARGKMRDGFTFQLSEHPWKPRIAIKHLSSRSAFIQFTAPRKRNDTRGMRKRALAAPVRRGTFIDLKTVSAALTSNSHSLASLAEFLELPVRKAKTDEHGKALTSEYLDYAMQDVEVTWRAYVRLREKYDEHALTQTDLGAIKSEAGLGKAYLKQMNIRPWREVQPAFPPSLIGSILSTYFGGRTEVRIRREFARVLYCDFLSMYPTVCTLMQLWPFVIAEGMSHRDTTAEIAAWLDNLQASELQNPACWQKLTTIVQIQPDDDILPVRASYEHAGSQTIGLNHLSHDGGLWFTLADCLASKILSGKSPHVLNAITFTPNKPQSDLKPIAIAGSGDKAVDPIHDDFYRLLIDRRTRVKDAMKRETGARLAQMDSEQLALKILANSTSYGIFIEMNVEDLDRKERRDCHHGTALPYPVMTGKNEQPGTHFHPLLGTLITGAARLMLALAERHILDAGLDWAFCDTDSMAIAKPADMDEGEFVRRAKAICEWFTPLNPYEKKGPIFKIEDENFRLVDKTEIEPLFSFAISSKRYVLFNRDTDGVPIIRKASAHGLGHLMDPYSADEAPPEIPSPSVSLERLGVRRWQYDLWFKIIEAADRGMPDQVPLTYHPKLANPAVAKYAATTPELLRWFKSYNANRPYCDQVKPFNFLCALHAKQTLPGLGAKAGKNSGSKQPLPKPISPFFTKTAMAAKNCFDRETGKLVPPEQLQTYREALGRYHLSPESKFDNGEPFDRGTTRRRHVHAVDIQFIGKESNNWEEQASLGIDDDDAVIYASIEAALAPLEARITALTISNEELGDLSGLNPKTVQKFRSGQNKAVTRNSISKVIGGISRMQAEIQETEKLRELAKMVILKIGIAEFARQVEWDASNMSKAVSGQRKIPTPLRGKLERYFDR